MTGYLHPGYAESLAEFGAPRELPRCGGVFYSARYLSLHTIME